MNLYEHFLNKQVSILELSNEGELLRKKWENNFLNSLSPQDKNSIYLEHFLWHVFSYGKLNCLENENASDAFNNIKKKACYIFYQQDNNAFLIKNADKVTNEEFENESDLYVVDNGFNWTYVKTHEDDCGPYFYKLE